MRISVKPLSLAFAATAATRVCAARPRMCRGIHARSRGAPVMCLRGRTGPSADDCLGERRVSGEGQPTSAGALACRLASYERNSNSGGHVRASIAVRRRRQSPSGNFPGAGGPPYLPAVMADVSTLLFRVAVPLRRDKPFQPFGSIGVGLARPHVRHHQGNRCRERTPRPASKPEVAQRSGSATGSGFGRRPRTTRCSGLTAISTGPRAVASSTRTCCVTSR